MSNGMSVGETGLVIFRRRVAVCVVHRRLESSQLSACTAASSSKPLYTIPLIILYSQRYNKNMQKVTPVATGSWPLSVF